MTSSWKLALTLCLLLIHLPVVLHVPASLGVILSLHFGDYIAYEVSLVFSWPAHKNGEVLGIHCACAQFPNILELYTFHYVIDVYTIRAV